MILPRQHATMASMRMLITMHRVDLNLLGRIFAQGERRLVRPLTGACMGSGTALCCASLSGLP